MDPPNLATICQTCCFSSQEAKLSSKPDPQPEKILVLPFCCKLWPPEACLSQSPSKPSNAYRSPRQYYPSSNLGNQQRRGHFALPIYMRPDLPQRVKRPLDHTQAQKE